MIKKTIQLTLPIIFMLCCEYPCKNNNINLGFIGFSPTEIDTLIVKSFKPNDNFHQPFDTILIRNFAGGGSIYTVINDTTFVYVNDSNPSHNISPGFDWQIYIPAKNRTISISNIVSESKEGGKRCLNPITSFVQDGVPIVPTFSNGNKLYISDYIAYIYN